MVLHLFESIGFLLGSLNLFVLRFQSLAFSLDMPRLLVVIAWTGVSRLALVPRGTQSPGGASTSMMPITDILDIVGLAQCRLLKGLPPNIFGKD